MKAAFAPVFLALGVLSLSALGGGCASSRVGMRDADRAFREGQYEEAADRLKQGLAAEGEGRDQLLYLLDLGLSLHAAGQYEESNSYFLEADRIAEIKDYTSLATESATLLTTDMIRQYQGEDFEKVLINTYLAMNFALMGNSESAQVEARRVNRKLQLMVTEGQRKYKQNAFARYLSAILYEADGNYNDAYVDYKLTRDLLPGTPGIGRDLWRMAWLMGDREDMERWTEEFQLTAEDRKEAKLLSPKSGKAEIIVLYENGISPIKRPNPSFSQIPKFFPRYNPVYQARAEVDGRDQGATAVLHDIEATAIQNLDEKYAALIARKVAGLVAKEVVADQIGRKTGSPLLGLAAKVFFYASDQADVRSWYLLPRDLQIARLVVEPGTHEVRLHPEGPGAGARGTLPAKTVQVEAGKKVFVNFRYVP